MYQSLLNYYHSIPSSVWVAIGASGIVSIVLQRLKHWLSLESDKVINFLLGVLSFCAVAINYILGAASVNPSILGAKTFMVMGLATSVYNFGVKPLSKFVKEAKQERQRRLRLKTSNADVDGANADPSLTPPIEALPVQEFQS